jgi:hypothetical protein
MMRKLIIISLLIPFVIIGCTRSNAGEDVSSPPVVTVGTIMITFGKSVHSQTETPQVKSTPTLFGIASTKTTTKASTAHPSKQTTLLMTKTPVKPSPVQGTPPPTPTTKVPMDVPVKIWREIPVMPDAVTGDAGDDRYRFMLTATVDQVSNFYKAELPKLGWKYDAQGVGENGAPIFIFSKQNTRLSISVIVLGEIVIVTLAPI